MLFYMLFPPHDLEITVLLALKGHSTNFPCYSKFTCNEEHYTDCENSCIMSSLSKKITKATSREESWFGFRDYKVVFSIFKAWPILGTKSQNISACCCIYFNHSFLFLSLTILQILRKCDSKSLEYHLKYLQTQQWEFQWSINLLN